MRFRGIGGYGGAHGGRLFSVRAPRGRLQRHSAPRVPGACDAATRYGHTAIDLAVLCVFTIELDCRRHDVSVSR